MRIRTLAVLALSLTLYAKGRCTDPKLNFTVVSSYNDPSNNALYNSSLYSDGKGTYMGGSDGVTATLQICNGSDGATLSPGSNRAVWLYLQNPVSGTTVPKLAQNPAPVLFFTIPFGLNAISSGDSFQTYLKVTLASPNAGFFDMEHPGLNTPFNPPSSGLNLPCDTAIVNVQHYAAGTYPGSPLETWVAWPDSTPSTTPSGCTGNPTQVGTVLGPPPHGNTPVNLGQLSVPFYIIIQKQ